MATSCKELTHWKRLMLGGIGGRRKRGQQRMRWLDGITDSMDVSFEWTPGVGDGQGGLMCCSSWSHKESDTTDRLNWLNWTEMTGFIVLFCDPKKKIVWVWKFLNWFFLTFFFLEKMSLCFFYLKIVQLLWNEWHFSPLKLTWLRVSNIIILWQVCH